jgi:hypothetical protein
MPCPQPSRAGLRSSAPPALPSESPITYSKRRVSHDESRVTSYQSQIPTQPCEFANPKSAPSMRRSRIGRGQARAPEVRHTSDFAPFPARRNRSWNTSSGNPSERSEEPLRIQNRSRRRIFLPPRREKFERELDCALKAEAMFFNPFLGQNEGARLIAGWPTAAEGQSLAAPGISLSCPCKKLRSPHRNRRK